MKHDNDDRARNIEGRQERRNRDAGERRNRQNARGRWGGEGGEETSDDLTALEIG